MTVNNNIKFQFKTDSLNKLGTPIKLRNQDRTLIKKNIKHLLPVVYKNHFISAK